MIPYGVAFFNLHKHARSPRFVSNQHDIANCMRSVIRDGFANGSREEVIVEKLVNSVKKINSFPIQLSSEFIHGHRSMVKYDFGGLEPQCELGDMFIISVLTYNRKRIFQRISFIQNKMALKSRLTTKECSPKWKIDHTQLYLLKHFPPMEGTSGLFKNCKIVLANTSRCLGSYGLLHAPDQMVFASAPLVSDLLFGNKIITSKQFSDITARMNMYCCSSVHESTWPLFFSHIHPMDFMELTHMIHNFWRSHGYPWYPMPNSFVMNNHLSCDILDFVKNWTLLNIGEPTYFGETVVNPELDTIGNAMLRRVGMSDLFELPHDDNMNNNYNFENGGFGIIAMVHDVTE